VNISVEINQTSSFLFVGMTSNLSSSPDDVIFNFKWS